MHSLGRVEQGNLTGERERLFDEAPVGLVSTDLDGMVIEVNAPFLRALGLTSATVIGANVLDLMAAGSGIYYETTFLPELLSSGHVRGALLSLNRTDDRPLTLIVNARIDRSGDEPRLHYALVSAIERLRTEQEIRRERQAAEILANRYRVLEHASTGFANASSVRDVAAALEEAGTMLTDAASLEVYVVVPGSGDAPDVLRRATQDGLTRDIHLDEARTEVDAVRTGASIILANRAEIEARYPERAAAPDGLRTETICAIPLIRDGVPIGVIRCAFDRERALDGFVSLLEALASQAAQTLERLTLQARIEHRANHDALTGLANRYTAERELESLFKAQQRGAGGIAILFIDLDGFKHVNDTLGHFIGDTVLVEVGRRIREAVRSTDIVCRLGGDEFLVICENVEDGEAVALAERVRAAVEQHFEGVSETCPLSASVGVVLVPPVDVGCALTSRETIEAADRAMYSAKRAGKNSVSVITLSREAHE
ncbi:diguanylate cyclase [Lysinibacter cavernae]|uniref:Diguanylate cyclase (GGDEF)-like protein/PAS domain S-box-containing protein n=1 Tax=Lysinibacter cavernae TaxID=1640652 RepID=A0A7X5R152_9MICO|nr:diguanylate cyclase [Lysinibacter cavernae]NIH53789.1 diguanylate cyclase (GGDEF)-like protein/PAS domain S-box-containing protein [Lysinibacter cavernae]